MQALGWRIASIALGVAAASLGCWGAYQYGLKLDGTVGYLTIAAPVVALAAALIPPLAEHAWRSGARVKALLWWMVLIPAALTVFFGTAERVHVAKASALAERQAQRNVADRAKQGLSEAKAEAQKAEAQALKAEAKKTCNTGCREAKLARDAANTRLEQAQAQLAHSEAHALAEGMAAPDWLLPSALDVIAFMAIWTGLTGPKPKAKPKAKRKVKAKAKAKAPAKRKPKLKIVTPTDAEHLWALKSGHTVQ